MSDSFERRRQALEEEFFKKQSQDLLEKLRDQMETEQPRAVHAFDQHLDVAVGQLEALDHIRDAAHRVDIFWLRVVDRRMASPQPRLLRAARHAVLPTLR